MAEENKAIEWPGGANVADDFDFLMVGKDGQPIMKIPKEKLNEVIVINGEGIKAVAGGASSANPTILAPGPAGQNRKMEDVTGWFVNGTGNPLVATGTPWEAPTGFKNTNWWDGVAGTWSLGSSVALPSNPIIDNLESESSEESLSARQGNVLEEKKLNKIDFPNTLFEEVGAIASEEGYNITDASGNVAFSVSNAGEVNFNGKVNQEEVDSKLDADQLPEEFYNRGILDIDDDSLSIADSAGNTIFQANKDSVNFIGKINSVNQNQSLRTTIPVMNAGDMYTELNFPSFSKKGFVISISCKVTGLSGGYIEFGFGKLRYRGRYLRITDTSVIPCRYSSTTHYVPANEQVGAPVSHNLVIEDFLNISLYCYDSGIAYLVLTSKYGNSKITSIDFGYEACFEPFININTINVTDVHFNLTNKDFKKSIWGFGDSYFGLDANRWPGQMKDIGFLNWYINGLAGQVSANSYLDLLKALKYGKPKYIFWCLGMNDSDSAHLSALNQLIETCKRNDIQLILATIPTVPSRSKEVINERVRTSGFRYVDFAKAVGATSSGVWYPNMLDADGVHPTILGAKALAAQVLIDFPEIMQEGVTNFAA